ncbi:MAG: DUF2541 family protein [Aeromonadaceae bacterium]
MRTLLFAITLTFASLASASDDFRLGSTLLLSVGESDAIVKPLACRYTDSLQLKVEKQDARIEALKVYYKDGSSRTVKVDKNFEKDERSSWLKLDRRKCVTKIRVEGYAKRKMSEVKIYGRRD